jgi:hypothetical protein
VPPQESTLSLVQSLTNLPSPNSSKFAWTSQYKELLTSLWFVLSSLFPSAAVILLLSIFCFLCFSLSIGTLRRR